MGFLRHSHPHKLTINYGMIEYANTYELTSLHKIGLPTEFGVDRSKNGGVVSRQTDGRTNPNYSMIYSYIVHIPLKMDFLVDKR